MNGSGQKQGGEGRGRVVEGGEGEMKMSTTHSGGGGGLDRGLVHAKVTSESTDGGDRIGRG